jgi:ATP-dependent RNA helicase RhlE
VHRIGRTGRAGCEGEAVSLVSGEEREFLRDIQKLLKREIPSSVVPGFEPGSQPSPAELHSRAAQPPDRGPRPQQPAHHRRGAAAGSGHNGHRSNASRSGAVGKAGAGGGQSRHGQGARKPSGRPQHQGASQRPR